MSRQDNPALLLAQTFRILGDQTRISIVMELQDGELNVTELCRRLKTSQPTVSRHLGILRMGSVVLNRRDGKEIYYSINDQQANDFAKSLKVLLRGANVVTLGPVVLGLAKNK